MDSDNNTTTVQHERVDSASRDRIENHLASPLPPFLEVGRWNARRFTITKEKCEAIWVMVKESKTLFSDLTQNLYEAWVSALLAETTVWIEICEGDTLLGLGAFMHLDRILETETHIVFFDRRPSEKTEICKAVIKWMFNEYPLLHRMYTEPPQIYFAAIRLSRRIGFVEEGVKRESILIGGKWVNQTVLSLLRSEI